MINILALPHKEIDKYVVYFDNILGHSSFVMVARKDGKPIVTGKFYCYTFGYVDDRMANEQFQFEWAQDVPFEPFTVEWVLSTYKELRNLEIQKIRSLKEKE